MDALLACPKNREEHLIRKLRSLWNRRLAEIAKRHLASTPATPTTGPIPATAASTLAPTESATETATTDAVDMNAASGMTSPYEENKHE